METFTRRSKRVNKRQTNPILRLEQEQAAEIALREVSKREEMLARKAAALRHQEKLRLARERKQAEIDARRSLETKTERKNQKKKPGKENKKTASKKTAAKTAAVPKKRSKPVSTTSHFASSASFSLFGSGAPPTSAYVAPIPAARSARTDIDLSGYSFGVEDVSNTKQLDLVFCLDCTSSMGHVIKSCQSSIVSLATTIVSSEGQDVRVCFIPYRDHQLSEEYCTKVYPFTRDINQMQKNVDEQRAMGGGDIPEAVTAAMYEAVCLDWRPTAAKVVIFMADAPPHGIATSGDTYYNGDPDGKDPLVIAKEMISLGISMYSILVTSGFAAASTDTKDFFSSVSSMTGGQCLSLSDASLLANCVLSGVNEMIDMESKMELVRSKIQEEATKKGSSLTREEVDDITSSLVVADVSGGTRSIPAEKLITTTQAKLDAAKSAASITELKETWKSLNGSVGGVSSIGAVVATEAVSSRMSRMAVARESRDTDRVLVECIMEGSKVRARVLSDGYDPNKNCQFPRDIREDGKKFFVDQIVDAGSFYRVKGNITPVD